MKNMRGDQMRYLFQGPQLVQSGHEPGLWELVYKYYRAHVQPDVARHTRMLTWTTS